MVFRVCAIFVCSYGVAAVRELAKRYHSRLLVVVAVLPAVALGIAAALVEDALRIESSIPLLAVAAGIGLGHWWVRGLPRPDPTRRPELRLSTLLVAAASVVPVLSWAVPQAYYRPIAPDLVARLYVGSLDGSLPLSRTGPVRRWSSEWLTPEYARAVEARARAGDVVGSLEPDNACPNSSHTRVTAVRQTGDSAEVDLVVEGVECRAPFDSVRALAAPAQGEPLARALTLRLLAAPEPVRLFVGVPLPERWIEAAEWRIADGLPIAPGRWNPTVPPFVAVEPTVRRSPAGTSLELHVVNVSYFAIERLGLVFDCWPPRLVELDLGKPIPPRSETALPNAVSVPTCAPNTQFDVVVGTSAEVESPLIATSRTAGVCGDEPRDVTFLLPNGKRVAVGGGCRIGRAPSENDLVFTDETISSLHARIERRDQTLVLSDAGSRNGIVRMDDDERVAELPLIGDGGFALGDSWVLFRTKPDAQLVAAFQPLGAGGGR
jgi:hypothetical protein